ncbi:D-aspartate oxidase-like [Galleria mellonella]|uniref:D-aspartate oxidase-like n=1 Tax=Galleria mellonella TaxID=7137 RepID=A0A6J3BUJ5_GALME|nr:D-aspartate oxidase-like [Galleria mellonella]XP_052754442.1 D-aspartate oxidase-like [Galleria mellonella]
MDKGAPNIAILGAGVVGLTVADILQKDLGKANITIIADKFKEDTTSAVAAGIFRPGTSFRGATREITQKWIDDSWHYWQDILKSPESPNAGVMAFSSYIFSKDNYHVTRNPFIENLVPIYRPVQEAELKLCGPGWKYGSYFTTLKIGCEKYLPWVERRFVDKGGRIVSDKVDSFTSLRQYDLVFNCTGLGAKYLCNDYDLVPLRGQVIKVKAPWLKTAFYGDYDTYIIPGLDGVATLGGVRQYDSYNLQVCKHDAAAILERCCQMLPALKKAEIIAHKVGLRPHRVPVRVEPEVIGGLKVVHCYGHGGYGVMCSPGTALNAVKIGQDFLKSNIKNKL